MAKSSFWLQFQALMKRNFVLKKRNKKQASQEIFYPVYFILILGITALFSTPDEQPARTYPENEITGPEFMPSSSEPLFVSPDTIEVNTTMERVLDYLERLGSAYAYKAPSIVYFASNQDAEDAYVDTDDDIGMGVHFSDDLMEYTIRGPFEDMPSGSDKYGNQGECRGQSGLDYCSANRYLFSGFVNLQRAIDAALTMDLSDGDTLESNITVQLYPKDEWTANVAWLQTLSAIYLVLAYSPFVNFLTVAMVTEKEKKIRDAMRMMGLRDTAFWLSWATTYFIIIVVVSLLCILLMFATRFLKDSDIIIFFFLLVFYGLTIITISFLVTPFFSKAEKAGGLAVLATMVFSLLYLPISLTRSDGPNGPESSIPLAGQFALALLSPVAFALAVDQAVYLDTQQGGMTWDNLTYGEFPISYSLIMLSVDFVLYGLLALYFDNVVPNEFGQHQKWYFFVQPSFWCPRPRRAHQSPALQRATSVPGADTHAVYMTQDDIEPVSPDLQDKDVVKILDIKKEYKAPDKGKPNKAVDGITLDLYEGQITCLLGHNGAGKSTLINMLTGLTPSTSGTATIYGYDVSEKGDMDEIRAMTGVCPQYNVLFDDLTCEEHLQFFGVMKGVESKHIDAEVARALADVELTDQKETRAGKLSGGQKRKLSVAIAIIGDPKVLLLDEPTAGMDPYSRRQLWASLKDRRANRVILLTTHFMDEADILADRKAFVSKGKLQCVGSSLFLKNRFGVGYHLGLVVDNITSDVIDKVTSLIRRHVVDAQLLRHHGMELNFTLPLNAVSNFATLFSDLEARLRPEGTTDARTFCIRSYGVSMTTLEEVFLKLGIEEETEENNQEDSSDNAPLLMRHVSRVSPDPCDVRTKRGDVNTSFDTAETLEARRSNSIRSNQSAERAMVTNTGAYYQNGQLNQNGGASNDYVENETHTVPAGNVCEPDDDLDWRRFKAMGKMRFLILIRYKSLFVFRIVMPVIFILIGASLSAFLDTSPVDTNVKELELNPDIYTRVYGRSTNNPNMTYQLGPNPGSESSQFIAKLREQGFYLTEIPSHADLLDDAPHHLGLTIYNVVSDSGTLSSNLTALYNSTATHSLPIIVNIISNTLLSMLQTANHSIQVVTKRWPNKSTQLEGWNNSAFLGTLLLGMAVVFVPPGLALITVKERETKVRSQLRISGVTSNMYWASNFVFDGVQYVGVCLFSVIILLAFQTASLMYWGAVLCLLLLFTFFIPTTMLVAYCMGFMFDTMESAQTVLPNVFSFCSWIPYMAVSIIDMTGLSDVAQILHIVLTIVDPIYAVYGGLYYISRLHLQESILQGTTDPDIPVSAYFEWDNNILITLIVPLFQGVVFGFLLRYLEVRDTGGDWRDIFKKKVESSSAIPADNSDIPDEEDDDVRDERHRVENMSAGESKEAVAKVQNLRKEFAKDGKNCCGDKDDADKIKVAVRNNTFAVSRGEVFGLLGPNGAGKTTTLNMVIAETGPTRGTVSICGENIRSSLSDAFQAMGYCPQHEAFWPELTMRQHLTFYATVRGLAEHYVPSVIDFFLESLQIEEHADKAASALSGGTKRKLSYIISMLGDPQLVLMDEPSTGMDPKSKRFLWDTISTAFKGGERGAILTTHYMEEADALCTRVGIMVNGQLECLGSTQHLKNKYGSGYQLEIKLPHDTDASANDHKLEQLESFVKKLFPNGIQTERFGDRRTYAIPQSDVHSLATVFSALETGKAEYGIEEYSFSQSSLEQVFLEFAKQQEEEGQPAATTSERLLARKSTVRKMSVKEDHVGTDL